MRLRNYIDDMTDDQMKAYAARCQISINYLRLHVKYATKDPSVSLIRSLTKESGGAISLADVLEHYDIVEGVVNPRVAA